MNILYEKNVTSGVTTVTKHFYAGGLQVAKIRLASFTTRTHFEGGKWVKNPPTVGTTTLSGPTYTKSEGDPSSSCNANGFVCFVLNIGNSYGLSNPWEKAGAGAALIFAGAGMSAYDLPAGNRVALSGMILEFSGFADLGYQFGQWLQNL